jgi:hypothetical protein
MYRKELELNDIDHELKITMIIPDKIENFLKKEVLPHNNYKNFSELLGEIGEGLLKYIFVEAEYEGLDRSTLKPVDNATFYAVEVTYQHYYDDPDGHKMVVLDIIPTEFKILGDFNRNFNGIYLDLDRCGTVGEGRIAFGCDRIRKKSVDLKMVYLNYFKKYNIITPNTDPEIRKELSKICGDLL